MLIGLRQLFPLQLNKFFCAGDRDKVLRGVVDIINIFDEINAANTVELRGVYCILLI